MNRFDRMMKKKRVKRYRWLVKLRKARDMSKKYREDIVIPLSLLVDKNIINDSFFISNIADDIFDSRYYYASYQVTKIKSHTIK